MLWLRAGRDNAKQAMASIHYSVICLFLVVYSSIAHLTCSIFKSIKYQMHNRQQPFPSFVVIPEGQSKHSFGPVD